ncbi:MAG: metallo-mystery pair system four-Cys motif protein [Sulfurovum sp. 16-42-52]|nr:MAG: metallo-mystery pair system four-Cys motif protein [Sulfurovum sp. 16-42-52]OZA44872.1 MAG: metallo-mystery pair system four-Cys motif protein [Sulfurovum sp. 17-42-90]
MNKRKLVAGVAYALLALTMINGCGGSSTTNETLDNTLPIVDNSEIPDTIFDSKITINFDAVVGDQGEVLCSQNGVAKEYTLGSTAAKGTIADFRFFVSDIKLLMSDGSTQTLKMENNTNQYFDEVNGSVAILDFEDNTGDCINRGNDSATYKHIVGMINPTASVEGIEFTIGVPLTLNHVEFPDIPALTKTSMAWSWASGRKFVKLETNPVDGNNTAGDIFNYHVGSTGCTTTDGVTTCAQPNRATITFDTFDPKTEKIVIDYAQLLTLVDIKKDAGGPKGCMSGLTDPECLTGKGDMLNRIGLDDVEAKGVCIDGDCSLHQKLFSVKPL